MLTEQDNVETHALAARGWSVSAIARHTGRDRKTVRRYLAGEGPLKRRQPAPNCLERFVAASGRGLRRIRTCRRSRCLTNWSRPGSIARIRRWCASCGAWICGRCAWCVSSAAGAAPTVELDHPPGGRSRAGWNCRTRRGAEPAYVLVGALSHSGRFRAVMCEQMLFGHLAGAQHEILVGLGDTRGSGGSIEWPRP